MLEPALETNEDWLRLQKDSPYFFHALLNSFLEIHNIRRGCVAPIHDRQRVLARDANRSFAVSAAKTGMFNQPGGGNFLLRIQRRITWNLQILGSRSGSQLPKLLSGDNWVFEKRSDAAAILIAGSNQHAFAGPDLSHCISHVCQSWLFGPSREVFLEVRVHEVRLTAMLEHIIHLHNNVSPALRGVEDAGAITKAASFVAQFMQLPIAQVKRKHRLNTIRDLLSVCSDVLDWGRAYCAGDAAEAFQTGDVVGDDDAYEFIPVFSRGGFEHNLIVTVAMINSSDSDLQHQARPACVRDEEITAATQDE